MTEASGKDVARIDPPAGKSILSLQGSEGFRKWDGSDMSERALFASARRLNTRC